MLDYDFIQESFAVGHHGSAEDWKGLFLFFHLLPDCDFLLVKYVQNKMPHLFSIVFYYNYSLG